MQSPKPTPDAAASSSPVDPAERQPTVDCELLELRYGPGGVGLLDSDDVDALIVGQQSSLPSPPEPSSEGAPTPARSSPRRAA